MSPHASWLLINEVVPRLRSAVPHAVHCVGAEDPEELIQDGTAMAAKMLASVDQKKKKVTAGNIAYYTIQHLKSGRRSTGSSNADVHGSATQLNDRSSVGSMDEVMVCESEFDCPLTFNDLISTDRDDPAQKAMRKLDWDLFLQSLDAKMKTLLEWMAEGRKLSKLAKKWRSSVSMVHLKKEQLLRRLQEFFGEDMWKVLAEQPQWKINLGVMQEYRACRYERQYR